MNLRTYVFGIMTGIVMVIGSFVFVSELAGIKWHPVNHQTADELYGCTVAQQAPNGECK